MPLFMLNAELVNAFFRRAMSNVIEDEHGKLWSGLGLQSWAIAVATNCSNLNNKMYISERLETEVDPFLQDISGAISFNRILPIRVMQGNVRLLLSGTHTISSVPWGFVGYLAHWTCERFRWSMSCSLSSSASTDELWVYIQGIWNALLHADIQNLFESMLHIATLIAVCDGASTTDFWHLI